MTLLNIGLEGSMTETAGPATSAERFGNAGFDVFSTPALLGLFERCAIEILAQTLGAGQGSVGTAAMLEHLAATPIGDTITISGSVVGVDNKSISFELTARDSKQLIGRCKHTRYIVDVERFMSKVTGTPGD